MSVESAETSIILCRLMN